MKFHLDAGRRRALSSLGLTLSALGLLGTLVVLCTLGQVEIGTFNAIDRYFRAFALWAQVPGLGFKIPVFPAGGAIGLILLVNLTAVLLWRLARVRRKTGLWLVHLGLVLFVVGEFATGMLAVESQMAIEEGSALDFSESPRRDELAVVELSEPVLDTVYAVRQEALREGRTLARAEWPFTIRVISAFANAEAGRRPEAGAIPSSLADQGLGPSLVLRPLPPVNQDDQSNQAAAYLEVEAGGKRLGTWLVSSALGRLQEFEAGGRRWGLIMRPERHYLPFTLMLKDFKHDLYAGTDIPKNFSSQVRLMNPATGEDREVLIWMNNPLRYLGRTFYQASFGKGDTLSVLQVVTNPAWLLPYISFGMVTLGLLIHFGIMLWESKAAAKASEAALSHDSAGSPARLAEAAALILAVLYLAAGFLPPAREGIDAARFGRIPVLHNGRIKPLDSIARNSLLVIYEKQTLQDGAERISASRWLLELSAAPKIAASRPLFVVYDPDLLGLLGRRQERKAVFSWAELEPKLDEITRQAGRVDEVSAKLRTRFEAAVHGLHGRLMLFHRLRNTLASHDSVSRAQENAEFSLAMAEGLADFAGPARARAKPTPALERLGRFYSRYRDLDETAYYKPVPPNAGEGPDAWGTVPGIFLASLADGRPRPEAKAWGDVLDAAQAGNAADFSRALSVLEAAAEARAPGAVRRAGWEAVFNRVSPFVRGMALYLASFLCAMLSYLIWGPALRRAALALLGLALLVHTVGLAARMGLQGRPPVTNLYSSAVFVGWIAVLLSFILERWHRRGLAAAVGAAAGFTTLLIAHHLSASGDTMEMMQAVLDSNFWLGTHVVTITIGYAGTFLAGLLAHVWIFRDRAGTLGAEDGKALYKMTYGTVAFSLLFSFVGTVLGGIWADQSWGRFWGWDPKENGAFMIVLWCAIILHARMGGFVRERGFMALSVLGCVVTALSWFGVNMLGIGLHSYGFMDQAAGWLAAFCASQLLVAAAAILPRRAAPSA